MSRLKLYDLSIPREEILKERESVYLKLSPSRKLYALFNLIKLSVKLNGGNPLKQPQGKGIVISKPLK